MDKRDLIIVGGGTSGLIAAYEARKKGLDVLLIEKKSFLGGRLEYAISFTTNRFQPQIYQLINELELEEIMTPFPLETLGIYAQGKVLPFTEFNKMIQMLPPDQQEAVNSLIGEAMQSNFDCNNPSENLLNLRKISFAQYLEQKGFSPQTIKMVIEPMLTFTFWEEIDVKKLSAEYGLFNIKFGLEMMQPDVFMLEEGIRILADILGDKIRKMGGEILTGVEVVSIKKVNHYFQVIGKKIKETTEFLGKNVLITVPPPCAKQFLPELEVPTGLTFESTKCFLVEGNLKQPQKNILGLPGNEANLRFLFEGPYGIFYAYPYFHDKPIDLTQFFSDFSIRSEETINCAFPIIGPNANLACVDTNIEGVFIAGDYYYYPNLNTCILTAKKAIEKI